jgi:hypothetical protein
MSPTLFLIGRALRMLLQELRQRERGPTNRLWVIVAVCYSVTELTPYDINMSRWRVTNIASRIQEDGIGQLLMKS